MSVISVIENLAFAFRKTGRRVNPFGNPLPLLPVQVDISIDALSAARVIRGERHKAVIIIHGVTQRSGTVYVGELLRLHPDLCAYPHKIYEVPFLNLAGRIRALQRQFLSWYPPNRTRIGNDDFLPLFGASFIAYLNAAVPDGQQAFLKMPDVSHLAYFPCIFPFERPLLLLRDGRDVVESAIKTWPERRFSDACKLWNDNAKIMLAQQRARAHEQWQIFRYEDAVRNPGDFVERLCAHFQLEVARYPFDRIGDIGLRGSSAHKRDGKVVWEPLDKPSQFNPIGRWRGWTLRRKQIFKRISGQTLIESGYERDGNW